MDKTKELLAEEIEREIKNLPTLADGSKEQAEAIEGLAKLYRLKIDEAKANSELEQRYKALYSEKDTKTKQLEEQAKERYVRIGIEVAGLILPMIFYASWMRRGFRFEETGTFTSATFKNLFNRFKPTMK
ncbi:hypothetical protein AALC25_00310 [Lachnospiraceae bacterium 29-84]